MDSVFILTKLGVFLQNLRPNLFLTVGSRSDGQYFRSWRGPSPWPRARPGFSIERLPDTGRQQLLLQVVAVWWFMLPCMWPNSLRFSEHSSHAPHINCSKLGSLLTCKFRVVVPVSRQESSVVGFDAWSPPSAHLLVSSSIVLWLKGIQTQFFCPEYTQVRWFRLNWTNTVKIPDGSPPGLFFFAALIMYRLSMLISCRVAGFLLGKRTPFSHCTQKKRMQRVTHACILYSSQCSKRWHIAEPSEQHIWKNQSGSLNKLNTSILHFFLRKSAIKPCTMSHYSLPIEAILYKGWRIISCHNENYLNCFRA